MMAPADDDDIGKFQPRTYPGKEGKRKEEGGRERKTILHFLRPTAGPAGRNNQTDACCSLAARSTDGRIVLARNPCLADGINCNERTTYAEFRRALVECIVLGARTHVLLRPNAIEQPLPGRGRKRNAVAAPEERISYSIHIVVSALINLPRSHITVRLH